MHGFRQLVYKTVVFSMARAYQKERHTSKQFPYAGKRGSVLTTFIIIIGEMRQHGKWKRPLEEGGEERMSEVDSSVSR